MDQQVNNKTISGDQADNNSVDTNRSITSIDLGVSNDSEIEQAKMQAKLEYEKAGTPQQITADKATEQQNQAVPVGKIKMIAFIILLIILVIRLALPGPLGTLKTGR